MAEIRELQPYTHGQDYQSSNLWLLDELCNINKHRRVLLAEVRLAAVLDDGSRARRSNAKIGIGPEGEVLVDGELGAYLAITEQVAKDIELCSALDQIARFIGDDLVPRFEHFFG